MAVTVFSEACSAVQVEDHTVEHRRKQTSDSSLTAWDGAFESSFSESITHCVYKKYSGIQWSGKNARFTACRECVVFLQRNGWLWTRVCLSPPLITNPIDLVASSRMFGSLQRTNCNSCACALGVLQHAHMTRRFGENFRTSNLRDPTKASPPRDAHRRSENRFWGELFSPQSSQSAGKLFLHVPRPYPQRRLQATISVRMGLVRGYNQAQSLLIWWRQIPSSPYQQGLGLVRGRVYGVQPVHVPRPYPQRRLKCIP